MNEHPPCATSEGGRYRLWLQFVGGEPASDPRGVMSDKQVSKAHAEMVESFMKLYPTATTEDLGLVFAIHGLGHTQDVTALLWVSEAK